MPIRSQMSRLCRQAILTITGIIVALLFATVPQAAVADENSQFSVGDASTTGKYYYQITDDNSATFIAVDLRDASDFDGTISVPDAVMDSDTQKTYNVTAIKADMPDEIAYPLKEGATGKTTDPNMNVIVTTRSSVENFNNEDAYMGGWTTGASPESWDDELHQKVKHVYIGKNVVTIARCAFHRLKNLESVTFATGSVLEEIGDSAFFESKSASSVAPFTKFGVKSDLEEGVFDFSGLTSLKSIGSGVFGISTGVKEIKFPASIESALNLNAFRGVEKVSFADGCKLETAPVFATSGTNAAAACKNLKSIGWGNNCSIKTIPAFAYRRCSGLEEIMLPPTVESIGQCAFMWCTSLRKAEIGDNVMDLPSNVFSGDTNLKCVDCGAGLATVSLNAFNQCVALTDVVFRGRNVTFADAALVSGGQQTGEAINIWFTDPSATITDTDLKNFGSAQTAFLAKNLNIYTDSASVKAFFEDSTKVAPKYGSGDDDNVKVTVYPLPDKSALTAALAAAPEQVTAAKAKYIVAEDAADVATGAQFVKQAAADALDAAIADAQAVADDVTATPEQIETATASIPAAIKAFEDSAAAGTNNSLAANAVIAALPAAPATDASAADAAAYKEAVAGALAAYDALTDEEKANVSELPALLAAQRAVAARDAADAAAAAQQAEKDLQEARQAAQDSADKVAQLEKDLETANAAKQVTLAKPVLTAKTKSTKKGKVTVAWKKVAKATGYELKVGKKTYTVKKATTLKKVVKAKKGKKVKVQVRAFMKQGTNTLYSAWSKAKKVKVKK